MEQKCDSSAPLDPTRPAWLHMGLRQNINILHHTLPTRANADNGHRNARDGCSHDPQWSLLSQILQELHD